MRRQSPRRGDIAAPPIVRVIISSPGPGRNHRWQMSACFLFSRSDAPRYAVDVAELQR
jgi:hypothetical protein